MAVPKTWVEQKIYFIHILLYTLRVIYNNVSLKINASTTKDTRHRTMYVSALIVDDGYKVELAYFILKN